MYENKNAKITAGKTKPVRGQKGRVSQDSRQK
jgi:hypothetical protein